MEAVGPRAGDARAHVLRGLPDDDDRGQGAQDADRRHVRPLRHRGVLVETLAKTQDPPRHGQNILREYSGSPTLAITGHLATLSMSMT